MAIGPAQQQRMKSAETVRLREMIALEYLAADRTEPIHLKAALYSLSHHAEAQCTRYINDRFDDCPACCVAFGIDEVRAIDLNLD